MLYTFEECSSLKLLDLSNWNTSNLTEIGFMFKNCNNLATLVLGKNTTNKTS